MINFGKKVVKFRVPIFIISLMLLIPSAFGYFGTKINYDILSYLPGDIETMKGQDILVDEFGTGAFSLFVAEGMDNKDVAALKSKIEKVEHVSKVIWYDSILDIIGKAMGSQIQHKEKVAEYMKMFKKIYTNYELAFFLFLRPYEPTERWNERQFYHMSISNAVLFNKSVLWTPS